MTQLLQINSSLFGDQGQSSQLTKRFVDRYQSTHPDASVITRDLALAQVPHLDAEIMMGFGAPAAERSEKQQAMTELSDTLIAELQAADILVLGLPLYNFTLPSTLKSYFDFIARAGITFQYTETGPVGLLEGKKAYVLAARGGVYQGSEYDTQSDLVRHFLAFIGITDVQFIYAEGLSMGDEPKQKALDQAEKSIQQLVA